MLPNQLLLAFGLIHLAAHQRRNRVFLSNLRLFEWLLLVLGHLLLLLRDLFNLEACLLSFEISFRDDRLIQSFSVHGQTIQKFQLWQLPHDHVHLRLLEQVYVERF